MLLFLLYTADSQPFLELAKLELIIIMEEPVGGIKKLIN